MEADDQTMSRVQGLYRSAIIAPVLRLLGKGDDPIDALASARRGRRVILLLVLLCLLNAFDLACTVLVHKLGAFEEANPVARRVLQYPNLVVLFKTGMVAFATCVLFVYRRRRCVELACWGVCSVYVTLAFIWLRHLQETEAVAGYLLPPS